MSKQLWRQELDECNSFFNDRCNSRLLSTHFTYMYNKVQFFPSTISNNTFNTQHDLIFSIFVTIQAFTNTALFVFVSFCKHKQQTNNTSEEFFHPQWMPTEQLISSSFTGIIYWIGKVQATYFTSEGFS